VGAAEIGGHGVGVVEVGEAGGRMRGAGVEHGWSAARLASMPQPS
jgi:hypothetical protein